MDEFFTQLWNLILVFGNPWNLPHPERYVEALRAPGAMWTTIVSVNHSPSLTRGSSRSAT